MKRGKTAAVWAATLAGLGGVAALLGNLETITSKPATIAENIGILKPKPVPIQVGLADLSARQMNTLILGEEAKESAEFQRYTIVNKEYCVRDGPFSHCPGAPVPTQTSRIVIEYLSDASFSGPWGPAVPVFDIVSIRPDQKNVLLTALNVEYQLLEADTTPYVELVGLDDSEGHIGLINHSSEQIKSVLLRFSFGDVVNTAFVEDWASASRRTFASRALTEKLEMTSGNFFTPPSSNLDDEFSRKIGDLDIKSYILKRYDGSSYSPYPPNEYSPEDEPKSRYIGLETTWQPSKERFAEVASHDYLGMNLDLSVMVIGEIEVRSKSGSRYISRFITPVVLSSRKEYGAGAAELDTSSVFVVDDKQSTGIVSKTLKLFLNGTSPTIRSNAALMFRRSGTYKLRFSYSSNDKKDFMSSNWQIVHAFASPIFVDAYFDTEKVHEF